MVGPNLPFGGLACGLVLGPLPSPAPTDKNKGVVVIDSEDEDTEEGLVFKRPRVDVAATSLFAINDHPLSFRDNLSSQTPRA